MHMARWLGVIVPWLLMLTGAAGRAEAAPEGQMSWAVHVTVASRWLDPGEAESAITPFLVLYAVGRAVIEFFRGDVERGMLIEDVLSVPQMLCIPTFFAGLAILLIRRGPEPRLA